MTVLRALLRELFPQREAALMNCVTVHHGSLGHASLRGIQSHGAVGEENEVFFRDRDNLFAASLTDTQRRHGFGAALDLDIHIRDGCTGNKVDAMVGEVLLKRTDQAVVLVVLCAQNTAQTLDKVQLVHEAHGITAHLDQAVIGLKRQHSAPIIPKLATEERRAESLLDDHIFELIFGA